MPAYRFGDFSPKLPPTDRYWIAPSAHVIGQVELGLDVGVWFGAVLRGDNEPIIVGAGTNIQEQVVIHTDPGFPVTIGEGCTLGHSAIVHGCTLGRNSLVGMGATILNGAVIGDNCLVGANALVTEGKSFPDNSLIVGSPAKALRTLDAEAADTIRATAEKYVQRFKEFKSELHVLK